MRVCSNVEERRFSAASRIINDEGFSLGVGGRTFPSVRHILCLLDCPRPVERRRLQAQQAPVRNVIERNAQAAVVIILERDKAERLEHAFLRLRHGAEYLCHGAYRARLRLKCNFDKIALGQRARQSQQSARRRNGVEFCSSVPAVFETNRSQDRRP